MTFLPILPWFVLLLWPPSAAPSSGGRPVGPRRSTPSCRGCGAARSWACCSSPPSVPGCRAADVTVNATDLDVFFLVDTTSSSVAEDWSGAKPRLDGMRTDVKAVATQLPGARYSVLTFDQEAVTRLPLTSDSTALGAAMDVLLPETSTYSQGSSVTVGRTALDEALQRDREAHPDRARIVFYLGDGEQTASGEPDPFDIDPALVNGGAVLGYGTTQGGRMKESGTRSDDYITDPSTDQPAVSVIDEKELQTIAGQLAVPYLHRTSDDGGAAVVDAVKLKETSSLHTAETSSSVGGRQEFYWVVLLLVAALAAWDLAVSVVAATALGAATRAPGTPGRASRRRLRLPSRRRPSTPTGGQS